MSVTAKVPHDRLSEYFTAFTRRFLLDDSPEAVDVEVLEPDLGDQVAVHGVRLLGITFDSKGDRAQLAMVGFKIQGGKFVPTTKLVNGSWVAY